ncbi:ROK family transcriptional regulator [Phytoactinopolyspora halotolerans]|uniref:ROK family transcriptional regulator n=1 Tax=Phytoactinopolyspora halotolerans TaxID=1981512 RepID=A0A6L9S3Q1_9ACTN|nr:ROK family transcriptional regulator [Phytoactinopolyspora halotolerans]NED99666.1 ROK family transcriptional regulator [Phytoactinopolyspora halotolerans]
MASDSAAPIASAAVRTGTRDERAVASRIVALISAGVATSRADLARSLGVSPSTVSLHVQELIEAGVIDEGGIGDSRGGRKPRLLRIRDEGGYVLVADLGGTHVRIAVISLASELRAVREIPVDVAEGPEVALDAIVAEWAELAEPWSQTGRLRGVALGLPGPVDVASGRVELPARMPGWHQFGVRDYVAERLGVPVLVDNDVNLMALGEHFAAQQPIEHSVTVKAGTAIGSGLITSGRLHRGATGAAGDITHSRVSAAGSTPCSCGKLGCLETIASGAAIVRRLRERGVDVHSTADVVRRTRDAEPEVTSMVREAGGHLGEVLCTVVNFVNPDAVFLGGALSTLEPFVAMVRSQLYDGCHPLITQHLIIARTATGAEAGVIGAGRLILQHVLADHTVP